MFLRLVNWVARRSAGSFLGEITMFSSDWP
nr:MAG TPA: hypothetical protein [Caudoviricetes sp.]